MPVQVDHAKKQAALKAAKFSPRGAGSSPIPVKVSTAGDDEDSRQPPSRLLSRYEVMSRVGVTYPTIWEWMKAGKFPRSCVLGPAKVAWLESEVEAWIAALPRRRLKGDGEKVA
jgi:prophage regulatory protein